MPYEIERKFIVSSELECDIADEYFCEEIEQSYLLTAYNLTIRLRAYEDRYTVTLKIPYGEGKVIELENEISPEDYFNLLDKSYGRMRKVRYRVGRWECDFLLEENGMDYFALVEIELKENEEVPELPKWVKKHLIYTVPINDKRFSNYKLGNIQYAKNLLKELINANRQETNQEKR